jgi:hypothetical protein
MTVFPMGFTHRWYIAPHSGLMFVFSMGNTHR